MTDMRHYKISKFITNSIKNFITDPFFISCCLWLFFIFISGIYSIIKIENTIYVNIDRGYDSYEYTNPILYWFKQNRYWGDYRMPGYGLVYGVFYALSGNEKSSNYMMLLANFAILALSIILSMKYVYKNKSILMINVIGAVWFITSLRIKWETISPDVMVMSLTVLTLLSLLESRFLIAGICLAGMAFMRPATVLLLPVSVFFVYIRGRLSKKPIYYTIRHILLVIIPYFVSESAWIIRNYIVYGDFRPLTGTKTVLHEPLWQGAAQYGYLIARAMGFSSDSRFTYMLWGGWDVDTSLFILASPKEVIYQNTTKRNIIDVLLLTQRYRQENDDSIRCEIEKSLIKKQINLLSEIKISKFDRIWRGFYHSMFTDFIFMYGSSNILKIITKIIRHPVYGANSILFILSFISTISILVFIASKMKCQNDCFLSSFLSISMPIFHIVFEVFEQRYFLIYTPVLSLSVIICIAHWRRPEPAEQKV